MKDVQVGTIWMVYFIKMSIFEDDIFMYGDNPKEPTKYLLERINEFINIAGYKAMYKHFYIV